MDKATANRQRARDNYESKTCIQLNGVDLKKDGDKWKCIVEGCKAEFGKTSSFVRHIKTCMEKVFTVLKLGGTPCIFRVILECYWKLGFKGKCKVKNCKSWRIIF